MVEVLGTVIGGVGMLLVLALVLSLMIEWVGGDLFSQRKKRFLLISGLVASFALVGLSQLPGGWWWLASPAAFLCVLLVSRSKAVAMRDVGRAPGQPALRLQPGSSNQLDQYGVRVLAEMSTAIQALTETEAARTGWLGDASAIDFSSELRRTQAQLLQIARLRTTIDQAKRLPDRTPEDQQVIKDAEAALSNLKVAVSEQVKVVEACARDAQGIDQTLQAQRRNAEISEKRAELRGQLAAMVSGIDISAEAQASDSADAVMSRVAAFHELKASLNPDPENHSNQDNHRIVDAQGRTGIRKLWPW